MSVTTSTAASNSDVLKRFGLSMIMRRAWFEFKFVIGAKAQGFAAALRDSWASFRAQINAERKEKARKAQAVANFKGDRNTRSPGNPFKPARFPEWGSKRNGEYVTSVCGR